MVMARKKRKDESITGQTGQQPKQKGSRRKPNPMNPFDGKPGFFNRLNRIVYSYAGPADVGLGRAEEPYVQAADPQCPICGKPMALHDIDRSGERTQLHCPK